MARLTHAFHAAHLRRYGTRAPVDAIEVVAYRLDLASLAGADRAGSALERPAAGERMPDPEAGEVRFAGMKRSCRFLPARAAAAGFWDFWARGLHRRKQEHDDARAAWLADDGRRDGRADAGGREGRV